MIKPTSAIFAPTTSVAPIPTVIPDPIHYERLGATGHRTLWVVFALMLIATIAFTALSWTVPISRRLFHILTTTITIIGTISYFAMATGQGVGYAHYHQKQEHDIVPGVGQDVYRQVFFVRYINWLLVFPLIVLNLSFLSGLAGGHILITVIANLIVAVSGAFFAAGRQLKSQKWGWFVIAVVAFLVQVWNLIVNARPRALARGNKVGTLYTSLAGFSILVWIAYPIIWAVAEGSRRLSVDGAVIAYAVLDVLTHAVIGAWLLTSLKTVAEANVELEGTWAYGTSSEGRVRLGDDGA